jgi:capsular polysaccharide export protein
MGRRVHVLEQGYLRPGWLTLEPDRFGGWRWDPAAEPPPLPEPPAFRAAFAAFAAMDVAHHAANLALGRLLFPHYRSHELWSPLAEWRGWLGKAAATPWRRTRRAAALTRLAAHAGPVFLMALQLETDFQLRDHGPPGGLPAVLCEVQASFARAAPPDALLVVKPHPLDPGLRDWRAALGPRSLWLDGGAAEALFGRLAGLVTVNSTLGLAALRAGVPVKVLGRAVYAPLADPRPLDAFWTAAAPPDPARVARFCAALAAAIQLPGAFDGEGMGPGARAVAARLLGRA